jgi:mycoredoxin-dependent peroxiredoxin
MAKIALNTPAPDFALPDFRGETVRLSQFQGDKNVVLVFNRGFV